MRLSTGALLTALVLGACDVHTEPGDGAGESSAVIGSIERLDPRMGAIVPPDAALEVLAEGHEWTEGPVWVPSLGAVLYSDIPRNAIYRWSEGSPASLWLQPSGYTGEVPRGGQPGSNGLALDGSGRLVLTQHGDRRIARLAADLTSPAPDFENLASHFEGRRFNSPNDLVVRSNGDVFFTDPPYGLEGLWDDPSREIPFQGVYRLAADGSLTLVVDDLTLPNGVVFSPDEETLYVSNSDRNEPAIMAYPVGADGGLGEGSLFFDSWGDGMTVDTEGNLYVAGPERSVLIVSPDGDRLGSLRTTVGTSNVAFGEDGSTLFITADSYLLRIRLRTRGVGF